MTVVHLQVIYYLRQDDVSEAYTLIKAINVLFSVKCQLLALASDDNPDIIFVTTSKSQDLEPTVPQEYILKGVVNAAVGQVIFVMNNIWVVVMTKATRSRSIPSLDCLINEGWSH